MKDRNILTIDQAADYLQIHAQTLYRLVRSGQLPARKLGKEWRVHREILDSFVKGEIPINQRQEDEAS